MATTLPTPSHAWTRFRARVVVFTAVALLGVLASGCAGSGAGDTALARQVKARTEAVDFHWGPARSFDDFLPTTT